tara:strand:- start:18180 stop:18383 length:204 start_codon:yes stop_codon:yes gene_type:complete
MKKNKDIHMHHWNILPKKEVITSKMRVILKYFFCDEHILTLLFLNKNGMIQSLNSVLLVLYVVDIRE